MYGTLESSDVFHDVRGHVEWGLADPILRSQALERASDYVSARYGHLTDVAPTEVFEKAAYIGALYELSRPGFFSVVNHPDDPRKVLVGVDTIKWEVVKGSSGELTPTSTLIDSLFSRYEGQTAAVASSGFALFVV